MGQNLCEIHVFEAIFKGINDIESLTWLTFFWHKPITALWLLFFLSLWGPSTTFFAPDYLTYGKYMKKNSKTKQFQWNFIWKINRYILIKKNHFSYKHTEKIEKIDVTRTWNRPRLILNFVIFFLAISKSQ
jgi:hypothetical protein